MITGSHPYSNLTCISSWYICIPNIIWIHQFITEKMNGNCKYQECDGRTDGLRTRQTSPYHNISCFQWEYKKSHAHLQCVHNNCARFEECQPKGVKGVDYTK
jgi:hypothetical protein